MRRIGTLIYANDEAITVAIRFTPSLVGILMAEILDKVHPYVVYLEYEGLRKIIHKGLPVTKIPLS